MRRLQPAGPKRQAGEALSTPQRTRGAWASYLGVGHILAHTWCLGFLPGVGHSQRTRGAWIALGEPGSRPIGDKWRVGHGSRLKENGLGVRTHDQWVELKDPILLGSSSRLNVHGS